MKRLNLMSILAAAAMLLAVANATTVAAQSQNLALGKNATQSTDIGSPFNASDGLAFKAVDGNTDGNWNSGSVTSTACTIDSTNECRGTTDPWWQVDLGADFVIDRIQIWNRTDCCRERLNNFRIWVKSSTGGWENFISGSGLHTFNSSEQYPLSFQGSKQARFVRVQLVNPGVILSLAEVMVFGSPVSTFGSSNPSSSGSSVEDQLWDAVKNSQRVQDFQDYLRAYPNGQYAAIANIKIRQLSGNTSSPPVNNPATAGNSSAAEDQFWETVKNSQRVQDFQDYLRTYPNGQYAAIANIKIRQLTITPRRRRSLTLLAGKIVTGPGSKTASERRTFRTFSVLIRTVNTHRLPTLRYANSPVTHRHRPSATRLLPWNSNIGMRSRTVSAGKTFRAIWTITRTVNMRRSGRSQRREFCPGESQRCWDKGGKIVRGEL